LRSAWTPEADAYYRKLFFSCVRNHPSSFVHLLLTQRLPLALAPAYYMGGDMWFTTHRLNEGLTRWQALRKYPSTAIRHEWLKFTMVLFSAILLGVMLYAYFVYRRALRLLVWLWIPWMVTITMLASIKTIEGRNLASNLIPEIAAAALIASRRRFRGSNPARQPTGISVTVPIAELRGSGECD